MALSTLNICPEVEGDDPAAVALVEVCGAEAWTLFLFRLASPAVLDGSLKVHGLWACSVGCAGRSCAGWSGFSDTERAGTSVVPCSSCLISSSLSFLANLANKRFSRIKKITSHCN